MKPIKLEFQGINSFSENTSIDFTRLTQNGIFGIFGDTGSGKSTILDCINFALYGNVERSRVMTDMINYRSDAAKVRFVFDILAEGRRKTYTVERSVKKDKAGTHKAFLYEKDGDGETCIADKASTVEKKIIEILGVEAEDFRKCIALPQGEFAQFVKSAPRDRLALIERLFSLSRYGDRLKEKLNARQSELEGAYQKFLGRLQGFEEVSEDALNQAYMGVKSKKAELSEQNKALKTAEEKCAKLKTLNEKRAELANTEKNLEEALQKQAQSADLLKDYAALPACNEAITAEQEKSEIHAYIRGAIEKIGQLERETEAVKKEISLLEAQAKEKDFDGKIAECLRVEGLYGSAKTSTEKLANLNLKLKEKRAEYRKTEEEKSATERNVIAAERALEVAKRELEALSEKEDKGFNDRLKGTILKEEYSYSLDYFANLKNNLKVYKEDSPLYKYAFGEAEKKVKEYCERVRAVAGLTLDDADIQLEKMRGIGKEREEKQKALSECGERLQKLKAALEIKLNQLSVAAKEGADIRVQIDEVKGDLEKIFGTQEADYLSAAKLNEEKLKKLKSDKAALADKTEQAKAKLNGLALNLERDRAVCKAREEEGEKLTKKLCELLARAGKTDVEACRAVAKKFENIPDAENFLKELDENVSNLKAKCAELRKIDGILSETAEEYSAAENERTEISKHIALLTGVVAVLENDCADLEKRLEEKKKILQDFSAVEKDRLLVATLKETTKSNKFMEYIANEYLYDISSAASITLLRLTDGRYFLTYKDNNFFVGDNFDCGNLRGVNTLSGGETFLVSLSLALALSETICSKSMKNIEFFFLDEGFGTLDSSLVDTVMSALEKLKSSEFTIGVISHVEELKHRIESKITVYKATESHGSTVSISC